MTDLTLDIRFHDPTQAVYGPLSTFDGSEVAPCTEGRRAEAPSGDQNCDNWQRIDGVGRVRISPRAQFRSGSLALRGGGQAFRVYYRDAPRSGHVDIVLLSKLSVDFVLPSLGGYNPSKGVVAFATYDCLGSIGGGTRVELSSPEVVRFYWTGFAFPDKTVETGGIGGFINVPAAQALELSTWLEGDSKPVSRNTILVADGWITSVQQFPATEEQAL